MAGDAAGIRNLHPPRSFGLVAALGCLCASLVVGVRPAGAVGEEWHVTPTAGAVGQTVTATGTGWDPSSGPVYLFRPGVDPDPVNAWAQAPVGQDGGFTVDVRLPTMPAGTFRSFACQICSFIDSPGPPNASTSFTIIPELRPEVFEGLPGTSIGVVGSGWRPGAPVSLYASHERMGDPAALIGSFPTVKDGTVVPEATFQVPGLTVGTHTFVACQLCVYGEKALVTDFLFRVTVSRPATDPTLLLAPDRQAVGTEVTVTGTGWSLEAGVVSVYADRADLGNRQPLATTEVLDTGEINTRVTVPDRGVEELRLYACQVCGDSDLEAEASLTVVQQPVVEHVLQVVPDSGAPGEELVATGTGWLDGPVTILLRRAPGVGRIPLATTRVARGAFEVTLTVPETQVGAAQLVACQRCDAEDRIEDVVPFTVLSRTVARPVLDIDSRTAEPGQVVTLSGAGWAADDGEVTVLIGPSGAGDPTDVWFRVQPGADGTFSEHVEVPDSDTGNYKVVACQLCDETPHPQATRALAISRGSDLRLVAGAGGGVAVLLAALLGVMLLRRHRVPRTRARDEPDVAPPLPRPGVRPVLDDVLDVRSRTAPDRPPGFELPGIAIVPVPDPAPLSEKVEVIR